jgi:hypothetical protein
MCFFDAWSAIPFRLGGFTRRAGTVVGLLAALGTSTALGEGENPAANPTPAAASTPPLTKVVDDSPAITTIDRPNFTMAYPSNWKEDVGGRDYDPNNNFTLVSPKNSYIQFTLLPTTSEPAKIVSDMVKKLDGPAITVLSKSKIEEWGGHKGQGFHLKGKIVGSFPGGIKVFVFTSKRFNVLIVENYFSDELRDVQDDFDSISKKFVMKN